MKILILGGSGFIGKNLSEKMLEKKHEIIILDSDIDFDFFKKLGVPEKNLYQVDLLEIKNYPVNFFKGVDIIFYLVNFTTPFLNIEETKEAYKKDVSVCIDVLEISRKNDIKKVIFSSSGGTIYGNLDNTSDREEDVTNPINYYGISKLALEKIILMYNQLYNMNNIILRISNPYGKYQNSDKVGIISIFLRKILDNEKIEIFGDGTNVRDYIYIGDLMDIFCKIIEKDSYSYNIFNIGSGEGKSILDIINAIKKITNLNFNIEFKENRNFDVKNNILDISRVKKEFNFTPKISLDEGIKLFYLYLKNK